jgi:hypothetical protein
LGSNFFIVGDKPLFSANVKLQFELVCAQMVIERPVNIAITETIVPLKNGYEEELYKLINMVMPGYYKPHTHLTGNYYGILKDGLLVAAAGERMQMNAFTELSAVVTHPHYSKRGYAKQLSAFVTNAIFN